MAENKKDPCTGCRGGFHCYKEASPCYLYYCGEFPGTGPKPEESKDKKEEVK